MYPQNIKVTTDAIVFSKTGGQLQVLLIRRKNEPGKGMWAFPGGFVEDGEELEITAVRELEEETGVKLTAMQQMHTFGKVGRDTRGRTVSIAYFAITDAAQHPAQGADDAAEAAWVNVKDITAMAFDHMEILEFALQRYREELE